MNLPPTISLGGVSVDFAREVLVGRNGDAVSLRPQSFAVLRHLAENAGRVVTKQELNQAIWPGVAVTDDSLVQCVSDIRRALGADAHAILKTVPRRGYMLVAEKECAEPERDGDTSAAAFGFIAGAPALQAASPAPDGESGMRPRLPTRRRTLLVALMGATLALVLVFVGFTAVFNPAASDRLSGSPVLAVLPFNNMSGDPDLAYLASGMTQDLIAGLSRFPHFRVVDAGGPVERDGQGAAHRIRHGIGAHYILSGSVQKSADRMRIIAQLIDAESGEHVWAQRFDRTGTDPFALQDGIVEETIRAIAGDRGLIQKKEYEAAWGKDAGSLDEYDYYLRGHDLFMRFTPAGVEEAGRIWEEALVRYPASGLLQIKLAYVHFVRVQLGGSDDPERDLAAAWTLAERGLAVTPQSPLSQTIGHMLMAELHFYKHDFDQAMRERALVLQLAPYDYFPKAALAYIPVGAGKPDEAISSLSDITPHHPLADFGYAALTWAHFARRDYRASIAAAEAALAPVPTFAWVFAAASHAELGETEAAKAALAKLMMAVPDASIAMVRELHPNADAEVVEREIAALRRIGLPESNSQSRVATHERGT